MNKRILKQYFFSVLLLAMVAVSLVILVLNVLSVLVDQAGDIEKNYTFAQVLLYTLWRVPGFLQENMGFAALVGCLIGLGMLASSNELTVVRSSGVSLLGLVYLVMRPVLMLVILGMGLGELAPYTDRIAEGHKAIALYGSGSQNLSEKQVWNREGNEFIRFDTVLPSGKVFGVTRFIFNDGKELLAMQTAREGTYAGKLWLLENVQTTQYAEGLTHAASRATAQWETELTPKMLTLYSTEPEDLTLKELYYYSRFLDKQSRESDSHHLAFWRKVLKPIEIFSLVLVAISFIFGPLRETSMGYRVFAGVVTGVIFKTAQDITASVSIVFGFDPVLAVLLPILVCASLGLIVLNRVR